MVNRAKDARKLANELIMVCLVMLGLLLVWNASQRIVNFSDRQLELAEHSVKAAVREVELLVKGYQRAVTIFAEENRSLLSRLELWPQDMENYSLLQEKIDRYFPEHFAFTLADSSGRTLLEGLEGLVGKRCREDIRTFSGNEGKYSIYRHQDKGGKQHLDIMSFWQGSKSDKAVFFISLKMNSVGRILENTRVPGHRLMLMRKGVPGQIEVASSGNMAGLTAEGRLDARAQRRISHSLPVQGTDWDMIILPESTLYSQAHRSILVQSLLLFAGCIVISVIMRMVLLDAED